MIDAQEQIRDLWAWLRDLHQRTASADSPIWKALNNLSERIDALEGRNAPSELGRFLEGAESGTVEVQEAEE